MTSSTMLLVTVCRLRYSTDNWYWCEELGMFKDSTSIHYLPLHKYGTDLKILLYDSLPWTGMGYT